MSGATTTLQNGTLTSSSSPSYTLAISIQRFKVTILDLLTGRHYRGQAPRPIAAVVGCLYRIQRARIATSITNTPKVTQTAATTTTIRR